MNFNADKETENPTLTESMRILVAGVHPRLREELSQLINKAHVGTCIDPQELDKSQETVEKEQVDIAIFDISSKDSKGSKVADAIKLRYPNIPVLLISIHDERISDPAPLVLNDQEAEQIISAVRYTQSLVASHIIGFTLVVNLEKIKQ